MIKKYTAKRINRLFENQEWTMRSIMCEFCKDYFKHEPYIYTYSDGQQTIACSTKCHAAIKREDKS